MKFEVVSSQGGFDTFSGILLQLLACPWIRYLSSIRVIRAEKNRRAVDKRNFSAQQCLSMKKEQNGHGMS